MVDLRRNNLGRSASPYLRQHRDNPIWWQEWGLEALAAASAENKPLFVSVGYSACHWCHVMAGEAFSDPATASFLNAHFICIKVDRETRPDIDQYLMGFIQDQSGSGGWPLNVFLNPAGDPVFALTYAPARFRSKTASLLAIAEKILEHLESRSGPVRPFESVEDAPETTAEDGLAARLLAAHDPHFGGFGPGPKFPPHTTLLFMLYRLAVESHVETEKACRLTLDAMRRGGLHDHLQGGLFRYCVDRSWTIPHFEKMLYDQAMALWTYALAFRVLGDGAYASMSTAIVRCLEETFAVNGLFATAFDADTEHHEGMTYLWDRDELEAVLTKEEFERFSLSYSLPLSGNFDGSIHLIRVDDRPLGDIEAKLLAIRRQRPQPARDDKILCGPNALTACALVQAARLLDRPELEDSAARTVERLLETFWDGSGLGHSSLDGIVQKQSFLGDAAALLLAVTMLREADDRWADAMNVLGNYVISFRMDGRWIESNQSDFRPVPASRFDHPVPSSVSLAVMGLARMALLEGGTPEPLEYLAPLRSDFHNIAVMIGGGMFHHIHARRPVPWGLLPPHVIQVRADEESDCYMGRCRPLDPELARVLDPSSLSGRICPKE
jgi:uncharacterized protein